MHRPPLSGFRSGINPVFTGPTDDSATESKRAKSRSRPNREPYPVSTLPLTLPRIRPLMTSIAAVLALSACAESHATRTAGWRHASIKDTHPVAESAPRQHKPGEIKKPIHRVAAKAPEVTKEAPKTAALKPEADAASAPARPVAPRSEPAKDPAPVKVAAPSAEPSPAPIPSAAAPIVSRPALPPLPPAKPAVTTVEKTQPIPVAPVAPAAPAPLKSAAIAPSNTATPSVAKAIEAPVVQPPAVTPPPKAIAPRTETVVPAPAPKAIEVRPSAPAPVAAPSVPTPAPKVVETRPTAEPRREAPAPSAPAPSPTPNASSGSGQQIAALPLPVAPSAVQPIDNQVRAVIGRAEGWLKAGNVANARALLSDAAKNDNPELLMALGETYDPLALQRYPRLAGQADAMRAVDLYGQAAGKGSDAAKAKLNALNAFLQKSR